LSVRGSRHDTVHRVISLSNECENIFRFKAVGMQAHKRPYKQLYILSVLLLASLK